MKMALCALQTQNQLETVAERMTPNMGEKQSSTVGFAMIDQALTGSVFDQALQITQSRLASVEANISEPFIPNDAPDFVRARLSIEHAMYV